MGEVIDFNKFRRRRVFHQLSVDDTVAELLHDFQREVPREDNAKRLVQKKLRKVLEPFTDVEKAVFVYWSGFVDGEVKRHQEVGQLFHLHPEQVRSITERVVSMLRGH